MTSPRSTDVRAWYRRNRARVDAAATLAISVFFIAVGIDGLWSLFAVAPEGTVSSWWALVTVVPGCVLIAAKDRAPMAALAAGGALWLLDGLILGSIGMLLVVLDLLYTATLRSTPRARRRLVVVLGVLTLVAAIAAAGIVSPPIGIVVGLQLGAMLFTAFWFGTAMGQQRELAALHERRADDAARIAAADRADAVRMEREAMARELHDVVAGHVSAVAIRAEASLGVPGDDSPERTALRSVRDSSLEAHRALRSMIAVLRGDGDLGAAPGLEAVPTLVDEARRTGLTVQLDADDQLAPPVEIGRAAARIVQESLANAARHASGGHVHVRIADDVDAVRVTVDSRGGAAVTPLRGSGWGLDLLRERATALGGEFSAGPHDGGWRVAATLPVHGERPAAARPRAEAAS